MDFLKNIIVFMAFTLMSLAANALPLPENLVTSNQLIMVIASDWNKIDALLQRYQRADIYSSWYPYGDPIPVVLGKKGLAWGHKIKPFLASGFRKKEGDLRTPAGVYQLGPIFGFGVEPSIKSNMSYIPINTSTVCIDNTDSIYYNQIIDTKKVEKKIANRGEQMREVPEYRLGSIIQYNTNHPVPGAGSCIFMHIWKNVHEGTAGCVAMSQANMYSVLTWLDSTKKPVILILPKKAYDKIQPIWHLPPFDLTK